MNLQNLFFRRRASYKRSKFYRSRVLFLKSFLNIISFSKMTFESGNIVRVLAPQVYLIHFWIWFQKMVLYMTDPYHKLLYTEKNKRIFTCNRNFQRSSNLQALLNSEWHKVFILNILGLLSYTTFLFIGFILRFTHGDLLQRSTLTLLLNTFWTREESIYIYIYRLQYF